MWFSISRQLGTMGSGTIHLSYRLIMHILSVPSGMNVFVKLICAIFSVDTRTDTGTY